MSIKKLTCRRCGYSWWPRTDKKPKLCPACKSRKYSQLPKAKAMGLPDKFYEDKMMEVKDETDKGLVVWNYR